MHFVLLASSPVRPTTSMCVWAFFPDQAFMQWQMNSWVLSSVLCQLSASLPSSSRPWSDHTAGYPVASLGWVPFIKMSSAIFTPLVDEVMLPLCHLLSWEPWDCYLTVRHLPSQCWRQGWHFPLRHSQAVSKQLCRGALGIAFTRRLGTVCSPLLCFSLLHSLL